MTVSILLLQDGVIACSGECSCINKSNTTIWSIDVGLVNHKMAVKEIYVYIPGSLWNKLLVANLKTGVIEKKVTVQGPGDVYVYGNYLAIETSSGLNVYSISNPKEPRLLWNRTGATKGVFLAKTVTI